MSSAVQGSARKGEGYQVDEPGTVTGIQGLGDTGGRWRNRVVGYALVDPKTLLANPKNYRIHPTNQQEVVEGSLDEIGWFDEITININTGTVVDGHLRANLALRHDEALVPCKYVDLSEEEEDKVLAIKDTSTSMAGLDSPKFKELLDGITTATAPLQNLFASIQQEIAQRTGRGTPTSEVAGSGGGETPTSANLVNQSGSEEGPEDGKGDDKEAIGVLDSEVTITIECSQADAKEFQGILREWGRRRSVTVSFM